MHVLDATNRALRRVKKICRRAGVQLLTRDVLECPTARGTMGACCSCICCPVCTACGTACSLPCATCCDYGGLAWLERDSTLAFSVASLLLGLILHVVMTVKCAQLDDKGWSPLPSHYEGGPCFGAGGNNSYSNHGFFGAVFMGVGFPFTLCACYARVTRKRHEAQRRSLGLAEPVTYWWGFTHSFRRVYYNMPMAPVVPGGLGTGRMPPASAHYPQAPFGHVISQQQIDESGGEGDGGIPWAAVVVDTEPEVNDDDRATAPPVETMEADESSLLPREAGVEK